MRGIFLTGLALLFFLLSSVSANVITGDSITGDATSENVGLTIVITGGPTLSILKPINGTYISNETLKLEVVSNGDNLWYNVDNQANTSFNKNDGVYFNVSEGAHTVYVFSNNSYGVVSNNFTFSVDSDFYNINYNEFKSKGSTINFNEYSFSQIQNLSDVILENDLFGRISFNEVINVTDDGTSDGLTDLDDGVNISFNRISLDSDELPNFNGSAILLLYGLAFSDPRILRDGVVCPASVCVENVYVGGTLSFNVTGFSVYSAKETPSGEDETPAGEDIGGGGGGGGSSVASLPETSVVDFNFEVEPNIITARIAQGNVETFVLQVKNTGELRSKFTWDLINEVGFVSVEEDEFFLNPGEAKELVLNIFIPLNSFPDVYFEKLEIISGSERQIINLVIEVEERDPLFDFRIEIDPGHKAIEAGDEMPVEINIENIGFLGEALDMGLILYINDMDGNIIYEIPEEVLSVETELLLMRNIEVPEWIPLGAYVVVARLTYREEVVSTHDTFEVVGLGSLFSPIVSSMRRNLIIFGAILLLGYILLRLYIYKKKKRAVRVLKFLRKISGDKLTGHRPLQKQWPQKKRD